MPSIVITAYNEESVIAQTLRSVLARVGDLGVKIIVVRDTCDDATVQIPSDPQVQVMEKRSLCNIVTLGDADSWWTGSVDWKLQRNHYYSLPVDSCSFPI